MQQIYDKITNLISDETKSLRGEVQDNYFRSVFGEVAKYYQYLSILVGRYESASKKYVASAKAQMEASATKGEGTWTLTPEEIAQYDIHYQEQTILMLELESFYLFTTILLDRIAAATQYYFGLGNHPEPWGSFSSMDKHFAGYVINKKLTTPTSSLSDSMTWLCENVSDFRNAFLSHKHEKDVQVRSHFGIGFSIESGGAYFNMGQMYPKEGETPIIAKKPEEIIQNLNLLIENWVAYIEQNAAKRSLTPPA